MGKYPQNNPTKKELRERQKIACLTCGADFETHLLTTGKNKGQVKKKFRNHQPAMSQYNRAMGHESRVIRPGRARKASRQNPENMHWLRRTLLMNSIGLMTAQEEEDVRTDTDG